MRPYLSSRLGYDLLHLLTPERFAQRNAIVAARQRLDFLSKVARCARMPARGPAYGKNLVGQAFKN
jgi:hypothetical protein